MSNNPSAKIVEDDERDMLVLDMDSSQSDCEYDGLLIGSPVKGEIYITTHECPFCHSKMQTIGVGHGVYQCSYCAKSRSRKIEMKRTFKSLENEE